MLLVDRCSNSRERYLQMFSDTRYTMIVMCVNRLHDKCHPLSIQHMDGGAVEDGGDARQKRQHRRLFAHRRNLGIYIFQRLSATQRNMTSLWT